MVTRSRHDRFLELAGEIARLEDQLKAKQKELQELMQDRSEHPTPVTRPPK